MLLKKYKIVNKIYKIILFKREKDINLSTVCNLCILARSNSCLLNYCTDFDTYNYSYYVIKEV